MDEVLARQSNDAEKIKRPAKFLTPQLKATASTLSIQLGMVFAFLLIWQFVVERGWISAFLAGSPAGIFSKLLEAVNNGSLWDNAKATVIEAIAGFLIGSLLGSLLGLSLWYSSFFARVVEPFIVAINSVPKIAFAPIVILWFGTGMVSKIMLATSMTFIIALIAAYEAAKNADRDLQSLMLALGSTKHQLFFKVVVPYSLPAIIATFRINIGFGLVGAVVGEFISSSHGLGHMIFTASSFYDLDTVWVGLFTLMLVGFILYYVVDRVERRLLPWKQADSGQRFRV
ncbi:hydroxymethylpyrimidine ABC transporter, transmembrane component [Sulfuriferula multivorans]|uniref:Hydroxymethylpyrimidine ABC transporter, transmembrane component n=1 Tax=Sulfuriferula multivorans TaxID=1559896 RepID=A0A401JCD4_9PROT|nr:ABC transporter permease [Sulfuriferula multivorans]GBL45234.1 hydroxymethylpyrimidine ABC transporter, transmembrane component [Sulfuriferula multivorans]